MTLIDSIVAHADELTAIRRDIHAHPEVGYDVFRTAELVAERLEQWGYAVTRGVGRTGVVGTLTRGGSVRAIGLRADMDALPVQEANTFAHRSTVPGAMHACGHDGHTAMLLGPRATWRGMASSTAPCSCSSSRSRSRAAARAR